MVERRIWWGIAKEGIGLLGTGWLMQQQVPRWNEGAAHWPIMFLTRKRAREEVRALAERYKHQWGWKFQVIRLEVTYRA